MLETGASYEDFNKAGSTNPISRFSNFIISQISNGNNLLTMERKRQIVKEAGDRFPQSLKRLLPDGKYQTTATNLMCVLENRLKTKTRKGTKRTTSQIEEIRSNMPLSKKKRFQQMISFSPNILPDTTLTEKEANNSIKWLKNVSKTPIKSQQIQKEKISRMMMETFAQQRYFIATEKDIDLITEQFPFFFNPEILAKHFFKITNMDLKQFSASFNEKSHAVVEFFRSCQIGKNGKVKKTALDDILDSDESTFTSLELIARYFKEDVKLVVQQFDVR